MQVLYTVHLLQLDYNTNQGNSTTESGHGYVDKRLDYWLNLQMHVRNMKTGMQIDYNTN